MGPTAPLPGRLIQGESHFERPDLIAKNVLHLFIQLSRSLVDEFEIEKWAATTADTEGAAPEIPAYNFFIRPPCTIPFTLV